MLRGGAGWPFIVEVKVIVPVQSRLRFSIPLTVCVTTFSPMLMDSEVVVQSFDLHPTTPESSNYRYNPSQRSDPLRQRQVDLFIYAVGIYTAGPDANRTIAQG